MAEVELLMTSDGSHTLLNTKLQETYHSVHGAIRESNHVFIQHGLQYFVERYHSSEIRILEIGFGTGLNALLALQFASTSKIRIQYTTLEAYPVEDEILSLLNYPVLLNPKGEASFFRQLHDAAWEQDVILTNNFTLVKKMSRIQDWKTQGESFDLVFFDAFAPSKQPEMWELSVLKKVFDSMNKQGVLVTYCAKGQLKRDLKLLGLEVETLAGPPGKKEMVRAQKIIS